MHSPAIPSEAKEAIPRSIAIGSRRSFYGYRVILATLYPLLIAHCPLT
jgi:hypothetical protein